MSKVSLPDFGTPFKPGRSFKDFLSSLPGILAAKDFKEVADTIAKAYKKRKPIVLGMGAHPVKVGLNPIIIDLMRRRIITAIAMNGAGIIHDFELASAGKTSEDVAESLIHGSFGMAEETGKILNQAIIKGVLKGIGIGESIGREILRGRYPYKDKSILATGAKLNIPVTVHVAIGTDIIHMHPDADGSAIGEGSHIDFRIFTSVISQLKGGVYINLGSAVIMPEVFLKALTIARNIGHKIKRFTTVNMDFIQHYRPSVNVIARPGGKGYALTGHHEIMFPLLAAAVLERIGR
ncbi:MAG: deoxyhypusine synthase family protein [Nitrospirae bacterium]|nr:deoxyhypusine synthase family protein [Nitrospirota bacterium]